MLQHTPVYSKEEITHKTWVSFTKEIEGEEQISSSLPFGNALTLRLQCDKRLGTTNATVVLRYDKSGECFSIPPIKRTAEAVTQEFVFSFYPSKYCQEDGYGLFFFCFQLETNYGSFYTQRENTFCYELSDLSALFQEEYRTFVSLSEHIPSNEQLLHPLTVYNTTTAYSRSLEGAVIYHIFVDRFAKGEQVYQREDAVYQSDWYHGIPEYTKEPGQSMPNNTHFGGNIEGIANKLPYLQSLGVNYIYLSPIFRSFSNHKYDTGNYLEVDELFGGKEALLLLIDKSKEMGIKIILDGVFNHTGDNSVYFNKFGEYPSVGAYQSTDSPYYTWYDFKEHPNNYQSWWGVQCLPTIRKDCEEFWEYIAGENGVIDAYTKMGIDGFRLDVADELATPFLHKIRKSVQKYNEDNCLIGEVWEDASVKVAYDQRRSYFTSGDLDGVISYPYRNAILSFLGGGSARDTADVLTRIFENYPHHSLLCSMNVLSTHDTERIITMLGEPSCVNATNDYLSNHYMTQEQKEKATVLLKLAVVLQFTLPGSPTVYYGDETGMEGGRDPFNRRCYPWGREDHRLIDYYRKISRIHATHEALRRGDARILYAEESLLIYRRDFRESKIFIMINNSDCQKTIAWKDLSHELLSDTTISKEVCLNPHSAAILA